MKDLNNVLKLSGVGVFTVLSLATVSQGMMDSNITTSRNVSYSYEATPMFNDFYGEVCATSVISDNSQGDILINANRQMLDSADNKKTRSVQLAITEVNKHVSRFDLEEGFEEL